VTVNTPNLPPTADFQFSPNGGAAPLFVFFDGSLSTDPDGPIASYTWNFGDGTAAATGKTPTHVFATAGTFTVQLNVQDGQGASASTTKSITVTAGGGGANPTISGRITFDRVPFSSTNSQGLSYANTSAQPAREVVVELIPSGGGAALATTTTDSNGNYVFTAPANANAFVRARAQARRTTSPSFNLRVLNNTNGNALYALDGSVFNTGTVNQTKNLNAASGWGGTSYTGTRAAAPFAILDTLYSAVEFMQDNGAAIDLPALDAFWSPLNNPNDGNVSNGDIVSTLYRTASSDPLDPPAGIYVLGLENNDTDEYDQHVIAHEFQHYLEDTISRADTPGGSHSANERLDLRLAFSEGFANAFSAMVLNNPVYRDSQGSQQSLSFFFNMESNAASPAGWYNEGSIQSLVWDLYDTAADSADAIATGYKPMYEVLAGAVRTTPALTSVYPFLTALKARGDVSSASVNSLATAQDIRANDAWGTGETNSGSVSQALPVYTDVTLNASPVTVCGSVVAGEFNKLGNRRFLRFTLGATQLVAIRAQYSVTGSTAPFAPDADPDIVLWRSGFLDIAESTTIGDELLTRTLAAGEYVIEVYEWSHIDPTYSASQRRGVTCLNVSVTG
jgi:PKD repeat protein